MSPEQADETIRTLLETIFRTSRRNPETVRGYHPGQRHHGFAGESVMRAIVFIVTFFLVFGGATVADTADNDLPNAGLFVFNAAPVDAPSVVASR
jgi:hypothetical protein